MKLSEDHVQWWSQVVSLNFTTRDLIIGIVAIHNWNTDAPQKKRG
jgi:hypothetical protein